MGRFSQRRQFRSICQRLRQGTGKVHREGLCLQPIGKLERNILQHLNWYGIAKGIHEILFRNPIRVPGADQPRLRVSQFDVGAQHIETRHGPGVEAGPHIHELPLQQLHRSFLHTDQFPGQKHVVIIRPHLKESIGDNALIIQQRLFFHQTRRADRGSDTPAFIN